MRAKEKELNQEKKRLQNSIVSDTVLKAMEPVDGSNDSNIL